MRALLQFKGIVITAVLSGALAACGGGSSNSVAVGHVAWTSGVFNPASNYANLCQSPRTGTDPITGVAYPDKVGSTLQENNFLRSWNNDLYLWYSEVTDVNPATYANTLDYFAILKTMATTPSGRDKDRFHFTYPTSTWESLSGSGVDLGYGVSWAFISSTPPRVVRVAYTEPGSAAVTAGLARGDSVLSIDGVSVNDNTSAGVDTLNEGLAPSVSGGQHTFTMQRVNQTTYSVTLTAAAVSSTSVFPAVSISTNTGAVGYVLFNDHLAPAEKGLYDAFTTLKADNVTDLVLDLRYNGGGYLAIASEAAYMIAGPTHTSGLTFENTVFNAKHPTTDPVAGGAIEPVPFYSQSLGITSGFNAGQALPYLGLSRVFVLTGPDTCSASESVINSLRGAGITVIEIGSTTCGKPYGFYPQDNCGTTYFSIQFKGINNAGFGDYPDGFSAQNQTTGVVGVPIPGCSVADDFTHALGDSAEGRLAAALAYRASGAAAACPAATGVGKIGTLSARDGTVDDPAHSDGLLIRSPLYENRIMGLPRT
jgi:C-terminal processing protease CtpA/Prc